MVVCGLQDANDVFGLEGSGPEVAARLEGEYSIPSLVITAGLLDGILDGDFVDGVYRGAALAAIALTTVGDQAHVTRSEVQSLMARGGRDVYR